MSVAAQPHRMHSPDRRLQLLEAALDVFSQRGYSGATTKEIAKNAGVTEAIVFRHFATKHELYNAVLDHKMKGGRFEEWLAKIDACVARNDDEGLFKAIANEILRCYRTDARFERMTFFAALEGHELGLEHHRRLTLPVAQRLTDYIARRQREGAIRQLNPIALLCAVAGAAQQYAQWTQIFGFESGISDEEAVDTFVNVVLKGVKA